jgi:hypothetical protein
VNLKYSHADIINMCRTSNSIIETIKKINEGSESVLPKDFYN